MTGAPAEALSEIGRLLPVVGFLAAVLVLATLCDGEGVFSACGALMLECAGDVRCAWSAASSSLPRS
jgi:arsenical pump membrane protein